MTTKVDSQNQSNARADREPDIAENFTLDDFDARLKALHDRIKDLDVESRLVWLKSGPHVYDAALDLSVKVEAVRWMLRVAKHVNGSARERIMLTVANSLDQLEHAVDVKGHAA
jgi:hypothetical protein